MTRLALPLLVLALPALAQDAGKDAATRYHDAYVLEVIDGRIADAAKGYLALERDAEAPARIRRQAAFRFAVCTALLGRADEARARLAALATDASLDAKLRAQIDEHRRALAGVEAGSALQKRLDDLLFKLGRANSNAMYYTPPVYRDFQILGEKARPFLRKLLGHSDLVVRRHAFRLLLRMDETRMAQRWKKGYSPQGDRDLSSYLQRNPDEVKVFEAFLRADDLSAIAAAARIGGNRIRWSAGSLRKVGARYPSSAPAAALENLSDPDVAALIDEWLRTDDEISVQTARTYVSWIGMVRAGKTRARLLEAKRFPLVAAALESPVEIREGTTSKGLREYADSVSTAVVLDAFEERIGRDSLTHSHRGVADYLADSLDGRKLAPAEQARYRTALVAWIERCKGAGWSRVGAHLRAAGANEDLVATLLKGPLKDHPRSLADYIDYHRPDDLARFGMLLRNTGSAGRSQLMNSLQGMIGQARSKGTSKELTKGLVRHAPDWLVLVPESAPWLVGHIARAAYESSPEEADACLQRCLDAAFELGHPYRRNVLGGWFSVHARFGAPGAAIHEFQVERVLPRRDEVLKRLPRSDRSWFVELLVSQWQVNRLVRSELPGVARTILANAEFIRTKSAVQVLAYEPETFPLEDWYHRLPVSSVLPAAAARAAAAVLAKNPDKAQPPLVRQALGQFPGLLDVLLRTGNAQTVARLAPLADATNVSIEPTRAALAKLLAAPSPDLGALGHLATVAAAVQADDSLVPVAARLLRAGEAPHVRLGIRLARSLAKPGLKKDLVALLDSPDANIRNAAKDALDAIAEWQRFREKMKKG